MRSSLRPAASKQYRNLNMARSLPSRISLISLFIGCLVLIMQGAADAIDCVAVDLTVQSCVPYLTSKDSSSTPSDSCCKGMKTVKGLGKERGDRQRVCGCLKSAAANLPGINPDTVPKLPGKCGVDFGYPIAMDTDCSKYSL
ncbi:Non-specific lipid-transfer protein 11 [Nymphaea thermarum]|nr:Non-specific lipid-transfer protein 11 [Nymphaea thermarum]